MAGADKFITVNGLKLHYVEHGEVDKPLLVCLHGVMLEGHSWDPFASRIDSRYHVLALTARGHGDSDRAENYEGLKFVEDTAAFLEAVGAESAVVCGLSMGGAIGLGLAALHPYKVAKLIVVDAGPQVGRTEYGKRLRNTMKTGLSSFDRLEEAMETWRGGLPGVADEEARRLVEHSTVRGEDGKLRVKTDPMLLKTHGLLEPPGGESDASDVANTLWAACAAIKCPTLIVRGSRSTGLTREVAERMVDTIPNAQLVDVDSDHTVPHENPDGFYEAVKDFI